MIRKLLLKRNSPGSLLKEKLPYAEIVMFKTINYILFQVLLKQAPHCQEQVWQFMTSGECTGTQIFEQIQRNISTTKCLVLVCNLSLAAFMYRVFIKYCVFLKISKCIPDSGLSQFFLGVYTVLHAWTTKWQVEHQRCSKTGRVKKTHNILRKNSNI